MHGNQLFQAVVLFLLWIYEYKIGPTQILRFRKLSKDSIQEQKTQAANEKTPLLQSSSCHSNQTTDSGLLRTSSGSGGGYHDYQATVDRILRSQTSLVGTHYTMANGVNV